MRIPAAAFASLRTCAAALLLLLAVGACGSSPEKPVPSVVFDGSASVSGPHRTDFGVAMVGGPPVERSISLRNTGRLAVAVEVGSLSSPFSRLGPEVIAIPPGGTEAIPLSFAPMSAGSFDAELPLRVQGGETLHARLSAQAVPVQISCTQSIDFGVQPHGAVVEREATCTNESEHPITVRVKAPEGDHADLFDLPGLREGRLVPAQEFRFQIRHTAAAPGTRTATLEVEVAGTGASATIHLAARGTRDALDFAESCAEGGVDLGVASPGTTSRGFATLRNLVEAPIEVEGLRLIGPDAGYFRVLTQTPRVLREADELQVEIEYTPPAFGEHSARLVVQTATADLEVETCVRGQSGQAVLTCGSETLDFGRVAVGMSRTRTLRCTNSGEGLPLYLVESVADDSLTATIVNDDGSRNPLSIGYAPGEGFDLELDWMPTAAGALDATVTLVSNAHVPDLVIETTGEALALEPCALEISPEELRFGLTPPGEQRRLDFHLRNDGPSACILSDFRVEGDEEPFQIDPIDEILLAAGDALRIPVYFLPQPRMNADQLEVHTAELRFEINDPAAPLQGVMLRGPSRRHCVEVKTPHLDFGPVAPGCQSRARSIELLSTCDQDLAIESIVVSPGADCDDCVFQLEVAAFPIEVKGHQPRIELPIVYRPAALGEDVGAAWIYLEGQAEPLMINLLGTGTADEYHTETFTQQAQPKVDLLWVIDDSSCMGLEQNTIAENAHAFLAHARNEGIDFQIGVTTMDVTIEGPQGRLVPLPPVSEPRILHSSMPDLEALFASRVRLGTSGASTEAGLEAARLAMELRNVEDDPSTSVPNDGNLGFVRPDASLSIIFVTDEGDYSPSPTSHYVDYFRGLKRPDMLRVHGIIPDPGNGCTGAWDNGDRYFDLIQATGGHWESICTPDLPASIAEMGRQAFQFGDGVRRYVLTGTPACEEPCSDAGVQVRVDGLPTPQRSHGAWVWRYVAAGNAIEFTKDFRPPEGSQVEITYPLQCIPAET